MIRYYLPADVRIPLLAASQCAHPLLRRLAGRGPWTTSETEHGICLQRGTATAWTEIKPGLDGLRFQVADPLPDFATAVKINDRGPIAWVPLSVGKVPVRLSYHAAVEIGLDGQPLGPCDEYGQAGVALWDRMQTGEVQLLDPQLLAFIRLALASQTDLTVELMHAYKLITSTSIPAIFEAATGLPKDQPAAG